MARLVAPRILNVGPDGIRRFDYGGRQDRVVGDFKPHEWLELHPDCTATRHVPPTAPSTGGRE